MKNKLQLLMIILLCMVVTLQTEASEVTEDIIDRETIEEIEEIEEDLISQLELEDMEKVIEELLPDSKLTFSELLDCVLANDFDTLNEKAFQYFTERIFFELNYNRSTLIHILVLTILAAIFSNFSSAFGSEQMANMGFYILYLLIILVSLQSFQVIVESVVSKVDGILLFMSALCPIYFLAVALSTGTSSAIVFYNLALLYIFFVEFLILSIVLPLINTYIIIQVLNYMTLEKRLSKLADFIKLIINWILKGMIGGVIGLNIIQGLLAPMIDSVKRSIWLKSAEAIPLVGDALGGTAEVILGTLKLIKNGVGVVGLILCIAIVAGPVIQMILLTLLYKFVAAIVEPMSDKRISGCMNSLGDGCQMLLQVLVSVCLLFLITIAIIATTTS